MKKSILAVLSIIFLMLSVNLFAQDESQDTTKTWDYGGVGALNISQAAFSNWAKGGESSYSGTTLISLFANRKGKNFLWENKFDFGYGLMYTDENGTRKTEDKLDLNSKIGYKWTKNINITGLTRLLTQVAPGYEFPNDSVIVSEFFAPAELVFSLGLDWQYEDWFSAYFSPTTGRFIIVMDQRLANEGAYGVDAAVIDENGNIITEGKNVDPQFGWYATLTAKKDIMENVTFNSVMNLFQNYTDDEEKNRMNIDVNWETTIIMKVNDLISANLFMHVIYDHDVKLPVGVDEQGNDILAPRTQFKEILGIGFSYKF